jgi:hypothetical protein
VSGGPVTMTRTEYDRVHQGIRMSRASSGRVRSWRSRSAFGSDHREFEILFSSTFRKIVLHAETRHLIDDDKIRHVVKQLLEFGARMRYCRNGKPYPVRHVMCSIITGLISALILDMQGTYSSCFVCLFIISLWLS